MFFRRATSVGGNLYFLRQKNNVLNIKASFQKICIVVKTVYFMNLSLTQWWKPHRNLCSSFCVYHEQMCLKSIETAYFTYIPLFNHPNPHENLCSNFRVYDEQTEVSALNCMYECTDSLIICICMFQNTLKNHV